MTDAELAAVSLQESRLCQPICERMGFRLVSPYKTFVRPDFTRR